MEPIIRKVWHSYTPDELDAVREKYTENQIKLEDLKEEKSSVVKRYSDKIKESDKAQKVIRENIKSGGETQEFECESRPNYATMKMEYYSIHSGELVDQRRMTSEERQMSIDTVDGVHHISSAV